MSALFIERDEAEAAAVPMGSKEGIGRSHRCWSALPLPVSSRRPSPLLALSFSGFRSSPPGGYAWRAGRFDVASCASHSGRRSPYRAGAWGREMQKVGQDDSFPRSLVGGTGSSLRPARQRVFGNFSLSPLSRWRKRRAGWAVRSEEGAR